MNLMITKIIKIIKKIYLINFFCDFSNFIKLKFNKFEIGFFVENSKILEFIKFYIEKKSKKKKVVIINFEKNIFKPINTAQFTFRTNFFRELVFLTLKLKYLYSSTPSLNKSLFKKSKFSNCKYIYLQHSLCGMTMIYQEDAFDYFDAVQAVSNFQYNDFVKIKKLRNLKFKIFKSNYLFLKNKINMRSLKENTIDVLIAPTWSTDFFSTKLYLKICELIKKNNISYNFRPHPMSLKKKEISHKDLVNNSIVVNYDDNLNYNNYRLLISDWSGIFIEFYLMKKNVILIDTKKKVLNLNYKQYPNDTAEIFLRNKINKRYNQHNIENIIIDIKKIINQKEDKPNKIDKFYFEL